MRVVEGLINQAIRLDADSAGHLRRLDGKVIGLTVTDTKWQASAIVSTAGVLLSDEDGVDTDVALTGQLNDFIALMRANKRGESLAAGRIEISGDLAVAQDVQTIMAAFDPDLESFVEPYLGEFGTHHMMRAWRRVSAGVQRSAAHLERDVSDYLHHEISVGVKRETVADFGRDCFALTDDVDRLAARVRRLSKKRAGT